MGTDGTGIVQILYHSSLYYRMGMDGMGMIFWECYRMGMDEMGMLQNGNDNI